MNINVWDGCWRPIRGFIYPFCNCYLVVMGVRVIFENGCVVGPNRILWVWVISMAKNALWENRLPFDLLNFYLKGEALQQLENKFLFWWQKILKFLCVRNTEKPIRCEFISTINCDTVITVYSVFSFSGYLILLLAVNICYKFIIFNLWYLTSFHQSVEDRQLKLALVDP